jgi:hypothetical protein
VTIRVTSDPAGARLLRDGEHLGTTPLTLEVSPSDAPQDWRLEKEGFQAQQLRVDLSADQTYERTLEPEESTETSDESTGEEPDEKPSDPTARPAKQNGPPATASDEKAPTADEPPPPKPDPEPEEPPSEPAASGDEDIDKIFDNTEF